MTCNTIALASSALLYQLNCRRTILISARGRMTTEGLESPTGVCVCGVPTCGDGKRPESHAFSPAHSIAFIDLTGMLLKALNGISGYLMALLE